MRIWLAMILACVATPAWAELTVYGHTGAWDMFRGTGLDGRQVCGIGNNNKTAGRAFSLRYMQGGDGLVFVAAKSSWHIPEGARLPVVMQIGRNVPWSERAVGHGDKLEWAIGRDQVQSFDSQFRQASALTLSFPAGNEQPWTISLSGSSAASTEMGRCITVMLQAAPPPGAGAPPPPPGPTQPFVAPGPNQPQ